jgi:hypothetical protein
MYQKLRLLIFLLPLCAFQCDGDDEFCEYTLGSSWRFRHLNNSGAEPLPSSGDVPRQAYAFRLSTAPLTRTVSDRCESFFNFTDIVQTFSIRTRAPWHGLAAGTEISTYFRVRATTYYSPIVNYLEATPRILTEQFQKPLRGDSLQLDFVLLQPPADADSLLLDIEMQFGAGNQVLLQPNAVFLK